MPEYYREIKPMILEIGNKIADIRGKKDIGTEKLEDFDGYLRVVKKLKEYHEEIIKIKPSLLEFEKSSTKEKRQNWLIYAIIAIIGALIGGFIL